MDDLISRQAAIDAIKSIPDEYVWFLDENPVICEDYEERKEWK